MVVFDKVVVVFLEEEEREGAFFLYRGFRRRSLGLVEFDRPLSLYATRFIDGICVLIELFCFFCEVSE